MTSVPVLLISGPIGAGKTSVVTTYLAARHLPALWYNVDARDVDAANLFHYLTLAARLATPRRKLVLPAFTAENQHGVAAFARGFFESLYEQRPAPSAIVLDDYHDVRSELFDEVVRPPSVRDAANGNGRLPRRNLSGSSPKQSAENGRTRRAGAAPTLTRRGTSPFSATR